MFVCLYRLRASIRHGRHSLIMIASVKTKVLFLHKTFKVAAVWKKVHIQWQVWTSYLYNVIVINIICCISMRNWALYILELSSFYKHTNTHKNYSVPTFFRQVSCNRMCMFFLHFSITCLISKALVPVSEILEHSRFIIMLCKVNHYAL